MSATLATGCVGGNTAGFKTPALKIKIPCLPISIPSFTFGFVLPSLSFSFILQLPSLFLRFKFNCNLANPFDITGGLTLPFAGGRIAACDGDVDFLQAAA